MMKHALLFIFALLPLFGFAQTLPRNEQGKYLFSEVVPVDGSQTELYSRALKALTPTAKEVIKQESNAVTWQDSKELMVTTSNIRIPVQLRYSVILQQKDGRYLYTITDLLLEDKKSKGFVPAENFEALQPLSKDLYTANNTLKPKGQALYNLQQAYLSEIEKTIAAEVQRIRQTMASPVGTDW
jgi:hypothetical protein